MLYDRPQASAAEGSWAGCRAVLSPHVPGVCGHSLGHLGTAPHNTLRDEHP